MKKILQTMLLCATILGATSCEQGIEDADKVSLSQTSYTMYSDAITTIDGTGLIDAEWDSDNEFVATANGSTLSSNKIGNTNLYYNGQKIHVTVRPRYSLYTEPDMSWGKSKNAIISKYGTPMNDNGNTIIYETHNSSVPYVLYMFDNRGLFSCAAVVQLSAAYSLVDFLSERYVFYSLDKTTYTAEFAHCYGSIDDPRVDYAGQMAYQKSIGGILVVYASNESTKGANTISNSMIEFIQDYL